MKGSQKPKKLGKKLAAGAMAGTMLAGGGAGAVKTGPGIAHSIGSKVDDIRYGLHGASAGGQTGAPGHIQLSRQDWINAGRPGTSISGGAPQFNAPLPGQASRTPLYETGSRSGVWGTNQFGNRELQPLKDIRPGQLTAQNGQTWKY